MQLSQIRYFLAVAEALSFTKAAEACAVSQPALSKAIRNLEEDLGVDLFDRNGTKVALSEFGRKLHVHLEHIDGYSNKVLQLAKIEITSGLEIGVMCSITSERISWLLKEFNNKYPNVELNLHRIVPQEIMGSLIQGDLDCVFCARENRHDIRFDALPLFTEEMVVVFPKGHRFNDMETVSLSEITQENYLDRLNCDFRNYFIQFTKSSGMELNISLVSDIDDWIFQLVRIGMGITIMPISSAKVWGLEYRTVDQLNYKREVELVSTLNAQHKVGVNNLWSLAKELNW